MILVLSLLTPFTMSDSLSVSFGFRIAQTRLMLLSIIRGLNPNCKLKAILEGCANLNHLWGSSLESHQLFSQDFFLPNCVYLWFTHINNSQPKFYIGSASHHVLDRCLELALIQEWQPRLDYPFICQFFHPKQGLLKRSAMNTNAQFGLATLWRRACHRFTPKVIKDVLASDRFQHGLQLWHIIHDLGSNTKARFETTKMLRSDDGGLPLCYALCRLAANIQEPYRTLAPGH